MQELRFYEEVMAEGVATMEKGDGSSTQYANLLHSLLKMRQACNHPWLVTGYSHR